MKFRDYLINESDNVKIYVIKPKNTWVVVSKKESDEFDSPEHSITIDFKKLNIITKSEGIIYNIDNYNDDKISKTVNGFSLYMAGAGHMGAKLELKSFRKYIFPYIERLWKLMEDVNQ
jgi:hypothetical protein